MLTHAIIDALLGAAALGDIGQHFPDTDERYRDADSLELLRTTVAMLSTRGFLVIHVDATVVIERPHVAPVRDEIRVSLAEAIGISRRARQRQGHPRRGDGVRRARGGSGGARDCHGRAMNRVHNVVCSSGWWARRAEHELIPFGLKGVDLGDDVLEIGPGFGATTRVLAQRLERLSVLELDAGYCRAAAGRARRLGHRDPGRRDPASVPRRPLLGRAVLHDAPPHPDQSRSRTARSRRWRGCSGRAGRSPAPTASGAGWMFKLIHVGDTLNLIDPDTLPARLGAAGMVRPEVRAGERSFRWRAAKA